jgi:putative hydrolase of the HAD superfamily
MITVIRDLAQELQQKPHLDKPQVIFFDAMGTLFGLRESVGEIYAAIAASFGVTVDISALNTAFLDTFRASPPLAFGESDLSKLQPLEFDWWQVIASQSFEKIGALEQFEDFTAYFQLLYDHFATAQPWFIYEDVIPCLNYWQNQGVELGIISNFDSRLHHLLVALELENYFQSVTLSSASQTAKPETPIFEQALAKHQSQPHQAWHIGDSFYEDCQGADIAGLNAFLIERPD